MYARQWNSVVAVVVVVVLVVVLVAPLMVQNVDIDLSEDLL